MTMIIKKLHKNRAVTCGALILKTTLLTDTKY